MILKMFRPRVLLLAGITALVLGGLAYGGYFLFTGTDHSKQAAPDKKQLWTCSMHPQVLKDAPGPCPICGMDLVRVKDHDHSAMTGPMTPAVSGSKASGETATVGAKPNDRLLIRVEPSVIQKLGVQTEVVRKEPISREIRGVAHIEFNEKNQTMINSRVNGWVESLYARFTGQSVGRGQALAGIYSPELVSTQEEYLQLYRQWQKVQGTPQAKDMEGLVAAARRRLRLWNISAAQIAHIEKTGKATRQLVLYSPYSGVVVEKHVVQGARIREGMDLFKIIDLSTVWAFVHVPEKDIAFVSEGMPAEMIVTQLPGKSFRGKVSFIFPYMDPQTRDLKVRVSLPNPGFQLRPGMYATLLLKSDLRGKHIVVPMTSVMRTGERALTFVYLGNGAFEPREVVVGVVAGDNKLQILSGLKEGEAVVVSGQFLLDSETRIQEAVRKLRAAGVDAKSMPGGHNH